MEKPVFYFPALVLIKQVGDDNDPDTQREIITLTEAIVAPSVEQEQASRGFEAISIHLGSVIEFFKELNALPFKR